MSATIELSQSLDPRQRLDAGAGHAALAARLGAACRSSPCCPSRWTTASIGARPGSDDTAADTTGRDTTRRGQRAPRVARACAELAGPGAAELKPLTSRPPLTDRLVLRVPQPWKPDGKYEVEIRGVRNVSGVAGDGEGRADRRQGGEPPIRPQRAAAPIRSSAGPDSLQPARFAQATTGSTP